MVPKRHIPWKPLIFGCDSVSSTVTAASVHAMGSAARRCAASSPRMISLRRKLFYVVRVFPPVSDSQKMWSGVSLGELPKNLDTENYAPAHDDAPSHPPPQNVLKPNVIHTGVRNSLCAARGFCVHPRGFCVRKVIVRIREVFACILREHPRGFCVHSRGFCVRQSSQKNAPRSK